MRLSHSKLQCILTCPMTYKLIYIDGLAKKDVKKALQIGSAVHWGIEHNTEDLTDYVNETGAFKQVDSYSYEQVLSESMVHGYLKHKDELFEQILTDPKTGEKLELLEETHELFIDGNLKSFSYPEAHKFVGIIDLLLLTNKGFIVVDYKTSTKEPDWNGYLEQLYRYCFLIRSEFPGIPIVKIAIINIRKTCIRQKKAENWDQFINRLKFEYELNDEHLVNYHEFAPDTLNETLYQAYIDNLSKMADAAEGIIDRQQFFINYGAVEGPYGKSDFYDIFYHTPNAEVLYTIADTIYDDETNSFLDRRDCIALDMDMIDHKVLNKYDIFKPMLERHNGVLSDAMNEAMRQGYEIDNVLLAKYQKTFLLQQLKNS